MANLKSAIKRHKQSLVRRERNRIARASVRTDLKKVRTLVSEGNLAAAKVALREAESALSKAGNKHLVHKLNASRKVSRLAKLVNSVKSK